MLSPVKIWRNQPKVRKLLGKKGQVVSFTKVHVPPQGFESQAPYIVVVVKLTTGDKYLAQLVDWDKENLKTGQKVVAILRKTRDPGEEGIIPYGIKFRPIE